MNTDLFHQHHLSRRRALGLAGAAAVTTATSTGLLGSAASAAEPPEPAEPADRSAADHRFREYTDEMFDVEAVLAGAWAPSRYGPEDQRGTFNEVTPAKTAAALRLLRGARQVKTYQLGEELFNGFPAYPTTPPRVYEQRLLVGGYDPGDDFEGILQTTEPLGPNLVSVNEERFEAPGDGNPYGFTYQIATQLDGLNHIGVGDVFYNGFRGSEIATTTGTTALGNETMGPVVTRGVVVDVLGLKVAQGQTSAYFREGDQPVLVDDYRITIEDIQAALRRQHVRRIRPGDVVVLRTGWGVLARTDPERYLAQEPGIYLREARWLAERRPAIIGSDTWALEVLSPAVTGGQVFPVHQLLLVKEGIRIGEGIVTDSLVEDGVFEYVHIVTPQNAPGATAGNTPPAGLAPVR